MSAAPCRVYGGELGESRKSLGGETSPAPGAELWQMHSLGGGGRRGDANCPRAQGGTAKTANEKAETKHFLEVAIFEWLQAALLRPACAHVSVAFCSGVCTAPADGASLGVNTMPVCTSIWPVLPGPPRGKVACPLSAGRRQRCAADSLRVVRRSRTPFSVWELAAVTFTST